MRIREAEGSLRSGAQTEMSVWSAAHRRASGKEAGKRTPHFGSRRYSAASPSF
jgi:hypothetical protein